MKIGVDISPLQTGHRMRGIGSVVSNFINSIPEEARRRHSFVFYALANEEKSLKKGLALLNLEGLNYEISFVEAPARSTSRRLPIFLRLPLKIFKKAVELGRFNIGAKLPNHDLDVFLHTDQSLSLPRTGKAKKVMIAYDIIPYVMEWDYLWSYRTARLKGLPIKSAFGCHLRRWMYVSKLKSNIRRADSLLAISEHTKNDLQKILGTPAHKITVTPLGVTAPDSKSDASPSFERYYRTSWGYFPRPFQLDIKEPYVLFVGGADRRRRLEDLVTTFNQIRAEGRPLRLILAGDSMQGPENISTLEIQNSLKASSYLDDIIFLGYVDESTRDWLYKNARAFIYPSTYEGFGLPVLEAMIHGCPVICYRSGAVEEVAGSLPIYASNQEDLRRSINKLLAAPSQEIEHIRRQNIAHAQKFSWQKTTRQMLKVIERS